MPMNDLTIEQLNTASNYETRAKDIFYNSSWYKNQGLLLFLTFTSFSHVVRLVFLKLVITKQDLEDLYNVPNTTTNTTSHPISSQ